MKSFEYGDEEIGHKEILFSVPSMVLGLGILTLPREVASTTNASDGWVAIMLAGVLAIIFAGISAKLAARFPKQSFLEYTARLVTKPVAVCLTLLIGLYMFVYTFFSLRSIANISKLYLFDRTPISVIALIFLLVVIYAVAGSRAGLMRLNLLFFPITLLVIILITALNLKNFEPINLKPFFTTHWSGYLTGMGKAFYSFLGFNIILFYISLMNRPEKATKAAMIGMTFPLIIYLTVFIVIIGSFGPSVTLQIVDPLVEMAKEAQVPGQFFERIEAIFFVIWLMTLFNTSAMALDITVITLKSVFPKPKKIHFLVALAPIIFLLAMMPSTLGEIFLIGQWFGYSATVVTLFVPAILMMISKIRGIQGHG